MSDDFDDILDDWAAKQSAWTLFDAVCLLRNIDPNKRKKPILLHSDDKQTTRYFRYALDAARSGEKFKILEERPRAVGAKRYLVDGKAFIEWAIKRWPDEALHLKGAILRYKLKKGTLSKTQRERYVNEVEHKAVFDEFVAIRGATVVAAMSAHEIYRQLRPLLDVKLAKPLSERKVRGLISKWKSRL